jgi:predicted nucleic acid-binding protein
VIDASVAIKWLILEIHSEKAERLLADGAELLAPDLIGPEICSAIWKRVRRSELTPAEGAELLRKFDRFGISIHPCQDLIQDAFTLGTAFGHSTYDCFYLALAERTGSPLVTADRRFFDAVRRASGSARVQWIEDAA